LGGIHIPSTPLHICRRPRRFARGARRSITRCDAFDTKERDISRATDRRIVVTRSLRACARCVARSDRSSHHADRSSSHADRSPTQPGTRDNRCERSSFHSARRSRRAVAFPAHGDQWAMHVDPSSNMKNASSRHAGASDTRWVRSSPHGDRCRTRLCSVVFAAGCFVSSSRRFIFELGCFVLALGCLVQARVRFVSSGDRPRDHGSMDHLLAAPDHLGPASLSSSQSTGAARRSTLCRMSRPDRRRIGWRRLSTADPSLGSG
jgi:hypothetical protein